MGRGPVAMALTNEQEARAYAWAKVFEDGAAATAVLDDMTVFASGLPETQQAGATRLLLYILLRRSQLRRQKGKEKK